MTSEPNLARLILDAKGDRSYERMSTDCGGLPTDKRLQQMATTPLKAFPDIATIRGLARGTGTTETAVVLAAARSLGLRVHAGEDPDALVIGGAGDLRTDQKDAIRALVRVFREMNQEGEGRGAIMVGRLYLDSIRDTFRQMPKVARETWMLAAERDRQRFEDAVSSVPAPTPTWFAEEVTKLRADWAHLIDVELQESRPTTATSLSADDLVKRRRRPSDGTQTDEEPYPGPHDENELDWAASHSPEPAGLPQPEEP